MRFVAFVIVVAIVISLGVLGWSFYLDHAAAALRAAQERELAAPVPLPRPAPHRVAAAKARASAVEPVEVVREPKELPPKHAHAWKAWKHSQSWKHSRRTSKKSQAWNASKEARRKSARKTQAWKAHMPKAKARQAWHNYETW